MRLLPSSLLPRVAASLGLAITAVGELAAAATAESVRCGDSLERDTILRDDLIDCRGDGLVIAADAITVNLNGHTVDGIGSDDSAGIRIDSHDGVTIINGSLRQFGYGIYLVDAADNRVLDNTVTEIDMDGIMADSRSSGAVITGNKASKSGETSGFEWADGIDVRGSRATIEHNIVADNHDDGIDPNGDKDRVAYNTVEGSGADGIDIDGAAADITHNTASGNGEDGIGIGSGASRPDIWQNTTNDNTVLGIHAIEGTVDGDGNRAANNGDDRQCVYVHCD